MKLQIIVKNISTSFSHPQNTNIRNRWKMESRFAVITGKKRRENKATTKKIHFVLVMLLLRYTPNVLPCMVFSLFAFLIRTVRKKKLTHSLKNTLSLHSIQTANIKPKHWRQWQQIRMKQLIHRERESEWAMLLF